jgi:hypothetical protein
MREENIVAEKLNGPGFGFRMQAAGQEVSTSDVARQVITRMSEAAIIREHQLHELLSYLDGQAQHAGSAVDESAYRDAADKLREVLSAPK